MDVRDRLIQRRKEDTSIFRLRLIDLNTNCLSELFKYLDISDLVILARANLTNHKSLDEAFTAETNAITHPYEASIRDRFLQLGYADCVTNNPYCIEFEKTAFRYFGRLIQEARLYYDPSYQRHNAEIEQVIMKYGSALSEIGLINADVSAFEDIREPFQHVTKLKFDDGWLGSTFLELNEWFPNLRSLTLNCTKISDHRFTKQEHPKLMELSVKNVFVCRCYRMNRNASSINALDYAISNLHLKRFLNLNPQLENLALFHDRDDAIFEQDMQPNQFLIQINFDLLVFIANTLLQLCYLKLNIKEMCLFNVPTYLATFRSLKTLVVETAQTNQLTQFNIVADNLNCLNITVHSPIVAEDYELLTAFVGRFKIIESLSIGHHPVILDNDNVVYVVKGLTNLKVLRVTLDENMFSKDLCYIVKQFDRLHTVRIHCAEIATTDRETFVNFVNENYILRNKNWRGSCIGNEFEFKKY